MIKTGVRNRSANLKREVLSRRGFKDPELVKVEVAEVVYTPAAYHFRCRMVVVCWNISLPNDNSLMLEEIRCEFYISDDDNSVAREQIVFGCNKRCDQENLSSQPKSGGRSLCTPTDHLVSKNACMLMSSIAWTLKSWPAPLLPVSPPHRVKHETERRQLLKM